MSEPSLVAATAGDPRVDAFHAGIYLDAFAAQCEPLAQWHAALAGRCPYELSIDLALADDELVGGVCYERYPRSGCGFVTYLVVAPAARRRGLGRRLMLGAARALSERGAPIVLCETNDPRVTTLEPAAEAWARLERHQRWGARVLDARYVQPALGAGLARDRQLVLLALPGVAPVPDTLPGATVRAFVDELYAVTEGGAPDGDTAIPDAVRCRVLSR